MLALWFSTVVALGPAPGNVLPGSQKQPPEHNQADSASNRQSASNKEKQQAATKEAECSNPNQNYHDCIIQLRTARATERQADEAWTAGRIAMAALFFAAVAAAGALWAANIAKRALFDLERAFVTVKDLTTEVKNGPDGKKVAVFRANFLNSGGSPTKHALLHISCAVMKNPLPKDFAFGDVVEGESARFVLGPGATITTSSIELPLDSLRGNHTYMWGWVEYDDIFARTPRHRTEFCHRLVMIENPSTREGTLHFETYRDHNGTDDECPPGRWRTSKGGAVIREIRMRKVLPKTA